MSTRSHGHHHHGTSAPRDFGWAFLVGVSLNTGFVMLEAVFGILSNSMALLSDAGHNLGDVLGLCVAWAASLLARRPPSARYTYGLKGTTIFAALMNAVIILLGAGALSWEAIGRLHDPQPIGSAAVIAVSGAGVLVNGITAMLFMRGQRSDMNIRGAFLHMAADALVSAGVMLSGLVIIYTGWVILDPGVSLAINLVIVAATWGLLRQSVSMSLSAVPDAIDIAEITRYLESQPGVESVHDLHVWPISTSDTAMTCHLTMPSGPPADDFLFGMVRDLQERFNVDHPTIQVERGPPSRCPFSPSSIV
jgi:cobalt-zinc-cadmium efflux system protein